VDKEAGLLNSLLKKCTGLPCCFSTTNAKIMTKKKKLLELEYRKLPVDGYVVWRIVDDFDGNIITFVHFYRRPRQLPVHRNNAGAAA